MVLGIDEFKRFLISELETKCGIKEKEISVLDSSHVDHMEESVSVTFSLREGQEVYEFSHCYPDETGMLLKNGKVEKKWGDWTQYSEKKEAE